LTSDKCKELAEQAKKLIRNDELNPCDIEVVNDQIPDEYQDKFWDDVMEYFDSL